MTTQRLEDHFDGREHELAAAAGRGDAAAVARLIREERADPNAVSKQGMPLLLWPLQTKNPAGFEALLENGADPNRAALLRGGVRDPALDFVVRSGDLRFLQPALRRGGKPDTVNADGEPLVHVAARAQAWDLVRALVEAGAKVDAFKGGLYGETVLAAAVGIGRFDQAYWLLEHGADPSYALKEAPDPARVGAQPILEDIFWMPPAPEAKDLAAWQEKCRQLLLAKGIKPPPPPKRWQRLEGAGSR